CSGAQHGTRVAHEGRSGVPLTRRRIGMHAMKKTVGSLAASLVGFGLLLAATTAQAAGPSVRCQTANISYGDYKDDRGLPCDPFDWNEITTFTSNSMEITVLGCNRSETTYADHDVTVYIPNSQYLTGLARGTYMKAVLYYVNAQNQPVRRYSGAFQYNGSGNWSWVNPVTNEWQTYLTPYWSRVLFY